MWDSQLIRFHQNLNLSAKLPRGVDVLNPYQDAYTLSLCKIFFKKYYHDQKPRRLLLGINPGRFGSGITGISFTDPVRLETDCGIANTFEKRGELSSDFIYRMITAYGGPADFFSHHLISAVSPLGFVRNGKNINYYDDPKLQKAVSPFINQSIEALLSMGLDRTVCYCIGEGTNFKFLNQLNEEKHWFAALVPLAHPRFVMQYRRKQLHQYIDNYIAALRQS
jgi:hypothetical protein